MLCSIDEIMACLTATSQRMLHVYCGDGTLGEVIRQQFCIEVIGIEPNVTDAERATNRLDMVATVDPLHEALPFPPRYFESVLITDAAQFHVQAVELLTVLEPNLNEHSTITLVLPGEFYFRSPARQTPELLANLREAGWLVYQQCPIMDTEPVSFRGRADGPMLLDDGETTVLNAEELQRALTKATVYVLVKNTYNPMLHAARLSEMQRADLAYAICKGIPAGLQEAPDVQSAILLEAQYALLNWPRAGIPKPVLTRLFEAQNLAARSVSLDPGFTPAYLCLSAMWHQIGDAEMASRLQHTAAVMEPAVVTQLPRILVGRRTPVTSPPRWTAGQSRPAILFIIPPRPHYGLDVLFDGLCELLGDDLVTEYPWKPTLHGAKPDRMDQYPCAFDRAGSPKSIEEICDKLRAGQYDLVLWGDMDYSVSEGDARRLADAIRDTPLVFVDQEDEPGDFRPSLLSRLGINNSVAYFKREYLRCQDFGERAYPLPFSYPASRIAETIDDERSHPLIWAGNRYMGLRRVYLDHIESTRGMDFTASYSQHEYTKILRESRAGISLFGMGFDTVRYWEVPAQGCALISEEPPTRIPNDFVHGESAIFFGGLYDIDSAIESVLKEPDRCAAIARSGYAHLRAHHTSVVRASELLGILFANDLQ